MPRRKEFQIDMKVGFRLFFRLARLTYFPGDNLQARRTLRRLVLMSIFLPLLFALQVMHWIGFLLDEIFYRKYRKINVKQPMFIVGVPRSGTTFLHRMIANDRQQFTTFTLWELVFALSISEKYFWLVLSRLDALVGRPLGRILDLLVRVLFRQFDETHKITLTQPEEDYLSLMPIFACFLLVVPFPFRDEIWHLAYFDERTPAAERRRVMAFYKGIVQRHLFVFGPEKRFLSKNPMFSPMVQSLAETFPDCRFVCNLRSPYHALPSLLSAITEAANGFDNDLRDKEHRDQWIDAVKFFYRHLTSCLANLPDYRYTFVRFDDLTANPRQIVESLYQRLGYELTKQYSTVLHAEDAKSRKYKSKHDYSLAKFDLNAESIYEEFGFVFEQFDFEPAYREPDVSAVS